jgi:TetR/AcrR family transcriptional regulator, transcriptional repressor for nem operon
VSRPGRPPKIEPDEQLRRAMQVFWRKGYYDTSVADLVAEAGVNRAAICGGHGGKKALFAKTLAFYEAEVTSAFLAGIEADGASLPAIEDFFRQFFVFLDQPISRQGCLLCNTSSEVAPDDAEIAAYVGRYLARLQHGFLQASERARPALRDDIDTAAFVDYCVGAVLGLMSLARSPLPRSVARNYLDGVLRTIAAAQAALAR